MKINTIIECINDASSIEGFYILYKNKKKCIGNYYKYTYTIYLHKDNSNKEILSKEYTTQIKENREEEEVSNIEKDFLTNFLVTAFKDNSDGNK